MRRRRAPSNPSASLLRLALSPLVRPASSLYTFFSTQRHLLPFTEQWSEYSQLISNAEASGAIQSKREPLTFGPFTPGRSSLMLLFLLNSVTLAFTEQWSEFTQQISNAEASGAIQSKRDQKLGNLGTGKFPRTSTRS